MIIVRDAPPFRKLPKPGSKGPGILVPKKHIIVPPKRNLQTPAPKVSLADDNLSMDERTASIIEQIIDETNFLEDQETRDLWLDGVDTFRKTGDVAALIALTELRRPIVPLDEFMYGRTYLGQEETELYPGVVEACTELDTDKYTEAVLKGALGGGKTTIGNIMTARAIYKLSCMRHPQTTFGIRAKSSLVITIQSIRLATAKKAIFQEFGPMINSSPYFRNIYPYDPLITSEMIFREQNLKLMPVSSSSTSVISMNVIAGILDELNFMQKVGKSKSQNADDKGSYDQAKVIYDTIVKRRKSRFNVKGKLPGLLFLISSSRFPDDFTEVKAAQSTMCGGTDDTIYVYSKSVWDSKGPQNFMEEKFRVQIGNATIRSRVLAEGEPAHPSCRILEVPMDFYSDFLGDPDGCLRDFGGISTLSTHPFITRRDAIVECMDNGELEGYHNPYPEETYNLEAGIPEVKDKHVWKNPNQWRIAHIDLGLKRDACGISIGHLAGQKLIEKNNGLGIKEQHLLPQFGIDLMLRVVPPRGGEIEFAKIRQLLLRLRDVYGLPIEYVTTDGFQSVDFRQIMRTHGFKADYSSVEKVEPYRTLRDAMYDTRVLMPKQQFVLNELAGLEYVRGNSKDGDKVDHRDNASKDVADGLCGVVKFLTERRAAWATRIERKPKEGMGHNGGPPLNDENELHLDAPRLRPISMRRSVTRRPTRRR